VRGARLAAALSEIPHDASSEKLEVQTDQGRLPALGLDIGTRRIGVSGSDPGGSYALPSETVDATDARAAARHIAGLVRDRGANTLVVGLPLEMNGREGMAARRVRGFLAKLNAALAELNLTPQIVEWDERLTTSAAEDFLISADVSRDRRKQVVDQIAATHILEGWLRGQRPPNG
jgi:putative Holliday junction resolvase